VHVFLSFSFRCIKLLFLLEAQVLVIRVAICFLVRSIQSCSTLTGPEFGDPLLLLSDLVLLLLHSRLPTLRQGCSASLSFDSA